MKISILTATYNRANLLSKLYESILNNLNANIEVEWLIMDDGSTDETKQAVETFVKENKRVFKLIHEKPDIFDNNGLNKKLYEDTFSLILDKYNVKENEKQYIFSFYTTGTLSIVLKWLENDCKDEIEFISNIIINIINQAR